jgi:hypothetical protein
MQGLRVILHVRQAIEWFCYLVFGARVDEVRGVGPIQPLVDLKCCFPGVIALVRVSWYPLDKRSGVVPIQIVSDGVLTC